MAGGPRRLPPQLLHLVAQPSSRPLPPSVAVIAAAARQRHGPCVRAMLFYGSCLRTGSDDGLIDLYLLVDSYRAANASPLRAVLNRLLPPNVFYLEVPFAGRLLRAKYAVLTLEDFRRGMARWFQVSLWGRFAQPAAILYVADAAAAGQVRAALAQAVLTLIGHTLPQLPPMFTAGDLWSQALALSYRCEWRAEGPEAVARLYAAAPDDYRALARAALPAFPQVTACAEPADSYRAHFSSLARRRSCLAWRLRAVQGKILSAARLLKAPLTFAGGFSYLLWKIERHSGLRIEPERRLRRLPLLQKAFCLWRLYRRGAFR